MPTIAPVESALDEDELAIEEVFDEVGFAPAEVAEAVLEGRVAREDAEADVDEPVVDARELVEEVAVEVLVADEDVEAELPEDAEDDLPELLDELDGLEAELDLESLLEESVSVTLVVKTVSVVNVERSLVVVNSDVVTNVETSSSSALRWPAFTWINPSSAAAIAERKGHKRKLRSAGEREDEMKSSR